MAGRDRLHPLLVLFSVLGGLNLIAGLLVASLVKTMLEDYGKGHVEEARSATTEHPS
nr:hypothetical protein [Nitrospirota bacterium]